MATYDEELYCPECRAILTITDDGLACFECGWTDDLETDNDSHG